MSIESQLKKMDITKMKLANGKTLSKTLYDEAQRLRDCIQKRIEEYRDEYSPVLYRRTDRFLEALQVEDIANIYVKGNSICIDLFFDNDKVMRKSGFGVWDSDSTDEVNIAYLLNYGYEVKKDVWFKELHDFGYREGYHFVEDGISDFLQTTDLPIKITMKYPDGYK